MGGVPEEAGSYTAAMIRKRACSGTGGCSVAHRPASTPAPLCDEEHEKRRTKGDSD